MAPEVTPVKVAHCFWTAEDGGEAWLWRLGEGLYGWSWSPQEVPAQNFYLADQVALWSTPRSVNWIEHLEILPAATIEEHHLLQTVKLLSR